MKFCLFFALALGLYALQDSQFISDEENSSSLEKKPNRSPVTHVESGEGGSLRRTQKHILSEPGDSTQRTENSYGTLAPSKAGESEKSPQEFRQAFSTLPVNDIQGRLANLTSFRGNTPEEKQFIRETLTQEFESQARQEASSAQRAYVLELQRIYLDHIEEPEDAEKNMQKWLEEFSEDRQFQDTVRANFLRRFPQFVAAWKSQSLGIGLLEHVSNSSNSSSSGGDENGDSLLNTETSNVEESANNADDSDERNEEDGE